MTFIGRGFRFRSLAAIACTLLGVSAAVSAQEEELLRRPQMLPTVFVHGFGGAASVYQSQIQRFSSNGVRDELIMGFEYDSGTPAGVAAAVPALDAFVEAARTRFGVTRVNLIAHSLGTAVAGNYLADPARAGKVAKYIGIDGASNPACGSNTEGTLKCMGIFKGSTGDVGGRNVYFNDLQTHVESVTSPDSFAAQFEFLTGVAPRTTNIARKYFFGFPFDLINIAGRVVDFPSNYGAGST